MLLSGAGFKGAFWIRGRLKDEKCRHAENYEGCRYESDARASRAACLWGATLQPRC